MLVTMLVDRVGMSSVGLWAHAAFVTWGCHNGCAVSYWAALYERAIYSILYRGEQVSGMNEANSDQILAVFFWSQTMHLQAL